MRAAEVVEVDQPPDTVTRAARAVAYVLHRCLVPELARLVAVAPMAEYVEARVVVTEALTYTASHTYALCLMTRSDIDDAGRLFRSAEVQEELVLRARRAIDAVMVEGQ